MGLKLKPGILFCNGVKLENIHTGTLVTTEISDENLIKCGPLKPITLTGTFVLRGMSRKRFVKLLMAQGYSRNHANRIAAGSRWLEHSYAMSAIVFGV